MCISKRLIIAIFGHSCTGKTSIAEPLAEQLGLSIRSCGTEIKRAAKELNVSPQELSDNIHSVIDAETLEWIKSQDSCIVEGRFLDCVLDSIKLGVIFIRLVASESERCVRMQRRQNIRVTSEELQKIDNEDREFRTRNYTSCPEVKTLLDVDTSKLSVEECVSLITTKLSLRR